MYQQGNERHLCAKSTDQHSLGWKGHLGILPEFKESANLLITLFSLEKTSGNSTTIQEER